MDSHQGLGGPGTEEGASGLSWWPGHHWSFLGWGGGKRGNLCAAADYWGVPSRDLLPLGIYGGGSDGGEKWEDPPVGLEARVGRPSVTHFIQVQALSLGWVRPDGRWQDCVPCTPFLGSLGTERVVVCIPRGL